MTKVANVKARRGTKSVGTNKDGKRKIRDGGMGDMNDNKTDTGMADHRNDGNVNWECGNGADVVTETNGPEETYALGMHLGQEALPGQVYTLVGDLGVGKTVFTQGVAAGLGITGPVSSPTFTILQVYEEGRLPFYHFDVYRIADVEEMEEIGYEDCFYGQGVCLIEWADLIREILPGQYTEIIIEKDLSKGFDYRRITYRRR